MESLATVNVGVLLVGLLVVAGIISSLVAERLGAPLLLIFLVIGMLAGEDGPGGIVFDDYQAAYYVGSFALAVILFDGGLRMRLVRFRGVFAPAAVLSTLGVVITAGIAGVAAMFALGLSLPEGLLVGAIIGSTDAAAVLFLLGAGGLQLKRRIGATLEIESGTNDPAALLLTVLLVQVVLAAGGSSALEILGLVVSQVTIGSVVGIVGGLLIVASLNRLSLPAGLPPLFAVAAAVTLYGIASVGGGSGFLAVYLAGLVVGNRPIRAHASVLRFHDAATWLAQIIMFVVLGLLVTPSRLLEHVLPALVIAAVLTFVARPIAVWLCIWPFGYTAREKTFISWVGLRGAVSIFLAAIPMLSNVPNGAMYFDVAFVVVLLSLTLQGWTVAPAARWAGVARTDALQSVNRVEIDLPDRLDLEMVGYPVQRGSYVLMTGRFPRWLKMLLVLRSGEPFSPADAGPLQAGDFAYFLAPRNRLRLLDRLFAPTEAGDGTRTEGLFSFRGDVKLDEVARLYGGSTPAHLEGMTIAEAFDAKYAGVPEVGDRIDLGQTALIASTVTPQGVAMAWLDLEPRGTSDALSPAALTRGTVVALRRLARRARRRTAEPAPPPPVQPEEPPMSPEEEEAPLRRSGASDL